MFHTYKEAIMKKNRLLLIPFLLIAMACFIGMASNSTATVIFSDDFDDGDLLGWTSYHITGAYNADAYYSNADPGNVAFLGNYNLSKGAIYQSLSEMLQANNIYTLSVDVGWRDDSWKHDNEPTLKYVLYAGTTELASGFSSGLTHGGGFTTFTLSYDALASDPLLGQSLAIGLAIKGGTQINLDNVSVASMANPIPMPILLLGTGLVGLVGFRRKLKK